MESPQSSVLSPRSFDELADAAAGALLVEKSQFTLVEGGEERLPVKRLPVGRQRPERDPQHARAANSGRPAASLLRPAPDQLMVTGVLSRHPALASRTARLPLCPPNETKSRENEE